MRVVPNKEQVTLLQVLGLVVAVVAIGGMHFVIAIVLSAAVFHEKIKPVGFAGIVLTVISILLIRI